MIENLLFTDLLLSISQSWKQIIYSAYRAKTFEANLECSLFASRLVGEPIKCARSPPFLICDWQAEHLSLSHVGWLRV